MTPSGKIQKFVLRDQIDAGELVAASPAKATSSAS
jgi:hypothetical protein